MWLVVSYSYLNWSSSKSQDKPLKVDRCSQHIWHHSDHLLLHFRKGDRWEAASVSFLSIRMKLLAVPVAVLLWRDLHHGMQNGGECFDVYLPTSIGQSSTDAWCWHATCKGIIPLLSGHLTAIGLPFTNNLIEPRQVFSRRALWSGTCPFSSGECIRRWSLAWRA